MSTSLFATAALFLAGLGACGSAATSGSDAGVTTKQEASVAASAVGAAVQPDQSLSVAYLAGGCFWCTEASFERIRGVQAVVSGYSGGDASDANYKKVAAGLTDHAEAIAVYYDSTQVSYRTLLDVFFVAHDPTTLNRQGPDVGRQYRSSIFYRTPGEQVLAKAVIDSVNAAGRYGNPIVTEVVPFEAFYDAEDYHQDYLADPSNPNQGYVQNVSWPKVRKVEKEFRELVKEEYLE